MFHSILYGCVYKIEKKYRHNLYNTHSMKFCKECSNMLYTSIDQDDSNKLVYYCRNCGYIDREITLEGHCVLQTQLNKREQKLNYFINKYTKMDPCLPRNHTMKCVNEGCKTNLAEGSHKPEIIYMRYDDDNLKYAYICVECDHVWKTDDKR